jgi:hypothetical protein
MAMGQALFCLPQAGFYAGGTNMTVDPTQQVPQKSPASSIPWIICLVIISFFFYKLGFQQGVNAHPVAAAVQQPSTPAASTPKATSTPAASTPKATSTPAASTPKATSVPAPPLKMVSSPKPKGWVKVITLTGKANKKSPVFTLSGGNARLRYTVADGRIAPTMNVMLYPAGTTMQDGAAIPVVLGAQEGKDETMLQQPAGKYYLDIMAANCSWNVVIEEQQ